MRHVVCPPRPLTFSSLRQLPTGDACFSPTGTCQESPTSSALVAGGGKNSTCCRSLVLNIMQGHSASAHKATCCTRAHLWAYMCYVHAYMYACTQALCTHMLDVCALHVHACALYTCSVCIHVCCVLCVCPVCVLSVHVCTVSSVHICVCMCPCVCVCTPQGHIH